MKPEILWVDCDEVERKVWPNKIFGEVLEDRVTVSRRAICAIVCLDVVFFFFNRWCSIMKREALKEQ